MRTLDKIRNYILREKKLGRLAPGDRLPSYHEIMNKLGGSCATVQLAMKKLAAEGLVEIKNGIGAFLAGAAPLKIKLFTAPSHMELTAMREMIMRRVSAQNLHLDVEVLSRSLLRNDETQEYRHLGDDEKVIITEANPGQHFYISGLANLQDFEGFDDIADALIDIPMTDKTVSLPFFAVNHQIGMNLRLMKKAGINPEEISGENFSWHNDVFKRCRESSVSPCSSYWSPYDTWWISFLDYILCAALLREENQPPPYRSKPVYNTSAGREAFEILAGHDFFESLGDKSKTFMRGGAALSFSEGSWFAAQCGKRVSEPPENFRFIPYSANGKKINFLGLSCLQTYLAASLTPDEKNRVLSLLRILVSKDFQTEYCGKTGFLSLRRDISAGDYIWNTRPDFSAFIPSPEEISIWSHVFPQNSLSVVSAFFRLHKSQRTGLDVILKSLDDIIIPAAGQ